MSMGVLDPILMHVRMRVLLHFGYRGRLCLRMNVPQTYTMVMAMGSMRPLSMTFASFFY